MVERPGRGAGGLSETLLSAYVVAALVPADAGPLGPALSNFIESANGPFLFRYNRGTCRSPHRSSTPLIFGGVRSSLCRFPILRMSGNCPVPAPPST